MKQQTSCKQVYRKALQFCMRCAYKQCWCRHLAHLHTAHCTLLPTPCIPPLLHPAHCIPNTLLLHTVAVMLCTLYPAVSTQHPGINCILKDDWLPLTPFQTLNSPYLLTRSLQINEYAGSERASHK